MTQIIIPAHIAYFIVFLQAYAVCLLIAGLMGYAASQRKKASQTKSTH